MTPEVVQNSPVVQFLTLDLLVAAVELNSLKLVQKFTLEKAKKPSTDNSC